ncbi:MAG TPA: lysylphosphatidylglycerol synthase transmembrane domain-containing protein [Ktedonobacteraceae bacterium]|nr:lysylphosphatidylglycerol synthase transmembrane domain-containing protein [Ktedonobacteraceae bacterium]
MITHNPQNNSVSDVDNNQSEAIERKTAELTELEQRRESVDARVEPEITRDQLALSKRLLNWRTLVPLVIVIVAVVFFVQKEHIDPQATWNAIRKANVFFFLAAFVIYYLSFPLRALRWRMLLENVGFTKENGVHLPKFWKLVEIIYISWFANAIVPAKLGDLYRAYLLRQEAGAPASRSFGTVMAERLLDLIVLLLLFIPALIISLHSNLPSQLRTGLEITLAAVVLGIIALFVMRMFPTQIAKLIPARFHGYYDNFQAGTLGSFKRVPTLAGLTFGVWACEALRFFFIALALNLISGNTLHIVTAAFFIALGEALLTVVPFTGGGVGLVEGGMLAMISLFNQGTTAALSVSTAAILLDRTISLLSIIVIGFIVFMIAFGRQAAKQPKQS